MGTIKSDLSGARQKATALKNATDKLVQSAPVTKDSQTTVAGNRNAQEAIQVAQASSQQIAQAIASASANIQSVAADFEAFDQKIGKILFGSLGGGKR